MAAYPCPSLPFPASFSCFLSATVSQLLSAPIHRGTPPLRDPLNVHAVAHSLKVTGVVSKFKYVSHLIHSKHFESKYLAVHRSLFCWLFIFMFIPAERGGLCCITHQAKPKENTNKGLSVERTLLLSIPTGLISRPSAFRGLWDKRVSPFVAAHCNRLVCGILSSDQKARFPEGLCYWHTDSTKPLVNNSWRASWFSSTTPV